MVVPHGVVEVMRALVRLERLHDDDFALTGESAAFPVNHEHRRVDVAATTASYELALLAGVGYRLIWPCRLVLHRKLKLLLPLLYQFL